MFYANDENGEKIRATKDIKATCPLCNKTVRAKCGEIVEWHWAHLVEEGCDTWSEPETPWHLWWKERAPIEWREVVIGPHRADILTPSGVIELQHSSISAEEIREREAFYGKMIWLLDGRIMTRSVNQFDNYINRIESCLDGRWIWHWPKKSFLVAQKRICIDLCTDVLEVIKLEQNSKGTVYIEGKLRSRNDFINKVNLEPIPEENHETVISLIAEYFIKRPRQKRYYKSNFENDLNNFKLSIKRQEFISESGLSRWIERRKPEQLEIIEWRGDGSLRDRESNYKW